MYCKNCGEKIEDGGLFCPNCGHPVADTENKEKTKISSLKIAIKVVMLLALFYRGLIYIALFISFLFEIKLISLIMFVMFALSISLTVIIFKKINRHQHLSAGFKLLTILFISFLGGILMIADND